MPTSYARATADAARTLEDAGFTSDEARLEAGILARGLLAWDRATWIAHLGEEAPHSFLDRFRGATDRRARREPVAYLVGSREFFGRRFGVTNAVLIPRPETELVVVEAIACLRRLPADRARVPSVIDVGTGSGCLAITIALEHPGARVTATDISAAALAVARQNASDLGARGRVTFQHAAARGRRRRGRRSHRLEPAVCGRDRSGVAPGRRARPRAGDGPLRRRRMDWMSFARSCRTRAVRCGPAARS